MEPHFGTTGMTWFHGGLWRHNYSNPTAVVEKDGHVYRINGLESNTLM